MLSCELPEELRLEQDARALVDADEPGVAPSLQVLVDGFSRKPDGLPERLLRDQNARPRHAPRILNFSKLQKCFCEAHRRAFKAQIFNLLARSAQPARHDLKEPNSDSSVLLQERQYIAPIQNQQLATRDRSGVCRSWSAVEERNLAEDFIRTDEIEDDFAPVGRGGADFDQPRKRGEKAMTRVAFTEDASAGRDVNAPGV